MKTGLFFVSAMILTVTVVWSAEQGVKTSKSPSTLNFVPFNIIQPPETEADWQFEISHVDLAISAEHLEGHRARNSDVKLIQYMLLQTVLMTDSEELSALKKFTRELKNDIEGAFLHFYDDTLVEYTNGKRELIPGWGGGTAKTYRESRVKNNIWGSNRFVYNFRSALVRRFKAKQYREIVSTGLRPDGIFIDESNPLSDNAPNIISGGRLREYQNKTVPLSSATYLLDLSLAYKVINAALGSDPFRGDMILLPNIGDYTGEFEDIGTKTPDGLHTEFLINETDPRSPGIYDLAKNLSDAGKILIMTQASPVAVLDNVGNFRSAKDKHQMYCLTEYWIARQGNSTYYATLPEAWDQLKKYWVNARDYDVGTPVDPLYSVWQSGTDAAGQTYKIYKRTYSRALMLSRPRVGWDSQADFSARSKTYQLPGVFKLLHDDGTVGGEITHIALTMGEAVTLIKVR